MRVVLGWTLAFATLLAVVMRHTFNGTYVILLYSCLRFRFGFIKLQLMFSMYQ